MSRAGSGVLLFALGFSLAPLGCGGKSDPEAPVHHVRGTVTYKDREVPAGTIEFVPKGGSGAPGFATIVNGKYDTSAPGGRGTIGGPHRVVVNAFDGKADPARELPHGAPLASPFQTEYDVPKQTEPATRDFRVTDPPK